MITRQQSMLHVPCDPEPLDLTLRPQVERLRDAALHLQRLGIHGIPTLPMIDAAAWSEHTPDEDWLIWRARRTAARLREMALSLSPGERIVGRPDLRPPAPAETREIQQAQQTLRTMPEYPGGDAGHFHPDFQKLFTLGIDGIRAEIRQRNQQASTEEQRNFYSACDIAMLGMSDYAWRVADACESTAADAQDGAGWRDLARVCRNVSAAPPATFHEAIQLMYLTIIAL